ncbi:L10-interacting MYB domain-containing protein-like [Hordeum vulgare]|nr:L10-interacting MYB domain-containing protein-like [Hordeum vulgare]
MEEVNNNNRDGGCLSKKGYENLERKFYEKVGEKLVRKQFKNKWDQLKKEYTWWMELLNATGLGWDPQTKTMDADDDWWKIHLEMRPDHAKFRNGPPPNLEQQDVMFRKAHVTGESAAIAGQETGGGKEAPILLEDDRGTSSKITGKHKFGAGEGNEKESPFFTVYNNALNTLVSRNEGSSSTKADKVPTMKEFLATVRECGVSEGTGIMFTASKLAMNRDSREMDDGGTKSDEEIEKTRHLLGLARDMAVLGYYGGALRRFVRDAPALLCTNGNKGYLDFFLKVVEALESGISKVDEDIESNAHDLLDSTMMSIFSNLRHLDPMFDHSRTMEPVPVELWSPLRDKVHKNVESLVRRFIQAAPSEESGSLGTEASDRYDKDNASSA